jgi:hypothetical protein
MVLIMLSENFHSTFAADDMDQSTDGIIENVAISYPGSPVSVLKQPLLMGGRSPRITRFGSNWRTEDDRC